MREEEEEGAPSFPSAPHEGARRFQNPLEELDLLLGGAFKTEPPRPVAADSFWKNCGNFGFYFFQAQVILICHQFRIHGLEGKVNMYEKPDHYTLRAHKEGYPARSVYKLDEIQKKFRVLKPGMKVLDIGAAPGSWSLFILKTLKGDGNLLAVDLSPLDTASFAHAGANFSFIQGDAFSPENLARFHEAGPFDLIVSDAAPATTGNRTVDTARSSALVEGVMDLAERLLGTGGNCVIKIFQGGDEGKFLRWMKNLFSEARAFKPEACRKNSFETYLIGVSRSRV